jgi:hypothetical protein
VTSPEHVRASEALRDFRHETNRGGQLWFVDDLAAHDEGLATQAR